MTSDKRQGTSRRRPVGTGMDKLRSPEAVKATGLGSPDRPERRLP